MIITLKERGGIFVLPDELAAYTVIVSRKVFHLAPKAAGYYATAACGYRDETPDARSHYKRQGQFVDSELHICRVCVERAQTG